MEIHRDLNRLPVFRNAALTTGTFDGVHKGHLKIISQLNDIALKENGESVLVTFHPHPRLVLQKNSSLQLLNSFEEKMELLELQGIDHVVVVQFTREFSDTPPEKYISDFLIGKLHARSIITGYDHRFGKDRKGDYKLLEALSPVYNYSVHEIPAYVLEEITISSTKIREALLSGDIDTANECLGYDYFLEGTVVKGNQIGRTIGFPTANIKVEDNHKLIPGYGIYAIEATLPGDAQKIQGMMSIGIRPTITDNRLTIEANLFDFNEDLYGRQIRVSLKTYLRPELKFDSLDALTQKIREDETRIRAWFQNRKQ